jgi:hypothetical protein
MITSSCGRRQQCRTYQSTIIRQMSEWQVGTCTAADSGHTTVGVEHGGNAESIAVVDLRRTARRAGQDQFVTRGQDADSWPGEHGDLRQAHGRQRTDAGRPDALSAAHDALAGANVLASRAHVCATAFARAHDDRTRFLDDMLLDHDGIRTRRHGCSGGDAHTLADFRRQSSRSAGKVAADDAKTPLAGSRQSHAMHGEAIHCGVREGRQVSGRNDVVAEDSSHSGGQRHHFAGRFALCAEFNDMRTRRRD